MVVNLRKDTVPVVHKIVVIQEKSEEKRTRGQNSLDVCQPQMGNDSLRKRSARHCSVLLSANSSLFSW